MHLNSEAKDNWDTEVDELDIFLAPNYIVTHHDHVLASIDETWLPANEIFDMSGKAPDHLLYKIIDNVVTDYMPIVGTH